MSMIYLFTGRPDVAIITSSKQGRSKNSYEMLWTVKSYSPILEYKLLYRPDKTNKSNQEIQYKRPMTRVSNNNIVLIGFLNDHGVLYNYTRASDHRASLVTSNLTGIEKNNALNYKSFPLDLNGAINY